MYCPVRPSNKVLSTVKLFIKKDNSRQNYINKNKVCNDIRLQMRQHELLNKLLSLYLKQKKVLIFYYIKKMQRHFTLLRKKSNKYRTPISNMIMKHFNLKNIILSDGRNFRL